MEMKKSQREEEAAYSTMQLPRILSLVTDGRLLIVSAAIKPVKRHCTQGIDIRVYSRSSSSV